MSEAPARSYLYAPGNNPKLLEKVYGAGAGAVVLDLEDAVPPAEKERARELVAAAIRPGAVVRVNGLDTGLCEDDVRAVAPRGPAALRLPKCESAEGVRQVAAWLEGTDVRLECAVETAAGVLAARELAAAHPRVRALSFGSVDFALDVGAAPTRDGRESLHARCHLVLASRAAGIGPPIDSVYPWLDDPEGLAASAREARTLGFGGKSAIHPSQLAAIHEAFAPTEAELERAQRVVEAFEAALARGTGALRLEDGTFVDGPVVERARRTLALAPKGDR